MNRVVILVSLGLFVGGLTAKADFYRCTGCETPKNISSLWDLSSQLRSLLAPTRGIHRIDAPECAQVAETARNNTLLMVVPAGPREPLREVFGKDKDDLATREEILEQLAAAARRDFPSSVDMTMWQIRECIRTNVQECLIDISYSTSTVNTTGGKRLITALHNISPVLAPQIGERLDRNEESGEILKSLIGTTIPAFFYNHQGRLIADPSNQTVRVQHFDTSRLRGLDQAIGNGNVPATDDFVALTISRSMSNTGYAVANQPPRVGEQVTLVGFSPTEIDNNGEPSNFQLVCSPGQRVSGEEAERRSGWAYSRLDPNWRRFFERYAVLSDTDSIPGMSGGAIVNSSGEVVAVNGGGGENGFIRAPVSRGTVVTGRLPQDPTK